MIEASIGYIHRSIRMVNSIVYDFARPFTVMTRLAIYRLDISFTAKLRQAWYHRVTFF